MRFSRGAHVEQLLEGMPDIKEFQVRVSFFSFFSCIYGSTIYFVRTRSDEQGFFAKHLHAFVSVIQNVLTVCRCCNSVIIP